MNKPVVKISIPDNQLMTGLFGEREFHLKSIEAAFPEVAIHARGKLRYLFLLYGYAQCQMCLEKNLKFLN